MPSLAEDGDATEKTTITCLEHIQSDYGLCAGRDSHSAGWYHDSSEDSVYDRAYRYFTTK